MINCGLCEKNYNNFYDACKCCIDEKIKIGHYNPKKTREEIIFQIEKSIPILIKR